MKNSSFILFLFISIAGRSAEFCVSVTAMPNNWRGKTGHFIYLCISVRIHLPIWNGGRDLKKKKFLIRWRWTAVSGAGSQKQPVPRGIVITAKHHDGFCLWPSAYSKHTVAQSKWREWEGRCI